MTTALAAPDTDFTSPVLIMREPKMIDKVGAYGLDDAGDIVGESSSNKE